jgi:hypothetical protein
MMRQQLECGGHAAALVQRARNEGRRHGRRTPRRFAEER